MVIKLYQHFQKKENSTKQPASNATAITLTGTLKEPCSVLHPVFRIERLAGDTVPSIYDYAYIDDFDRYYFVTDWRWEKPFWVCSLTVDVLASHRTDIGNLQAYIMRTDSASAGGFDPLITDTLYPATNEVTLNQYSITSAFESTISNGIYVVGIISGDQTDAVGAISYYAMTASEFGALKNALLSDNNLITMGLAQSDGQGGLTPLITDMSMEMVKAMYNPYQYIVSCMWFPFQKTAISSSPVHSIKIGWWSYTLDGNLINAQTIYMHEGPTTIVRHPQAALRGTYLNYAPYSRCTVYGIFGSLPLDLSYFDNDDDTLILRYIIDLISGQCRVIFQSYQSSSASPVHHNIVETDFLIGVPVQLAQIAVDYLGASVAAVDAAANTVGNALSLNIGGAISSAAHGVYNTINASMPQMRTSGTNGSFLITNTYLNTTFSYQFRWIVSEDIQHKGRPLCQSRIINTLDGYVLCSDGEFDISCLSEERSMISDFLTTGFFWE